MEVGARSARGAYGTSPGPAWYYGDLVMATGGSASDAAAVLNINVGILGHVDSGKTSLAKALSVQLSTAALDRQKQSQERGITIDLGFSAFSVPMPEHLKAEAKGVDTVQFTLVDCPGHASLIRTIMGGAQIIDIMLLVVDVKKGIQTQTAECLVIGEILADNLLVVLNKCDLLENPQADLPKVEKKLQQTFAKTKFGADVKMVAVSAQPGGGDHLSAEKVAASEGKPPDVGNLIKALVSSLKIPKRGDEGSFYFSVDHCFKGGRGTILTGTVLNGAASVGQVIELPALKLERPIKSIQMFRKPIERIKQGDRAGILLTDVPSDSMERGIACAPKTVGHFKSVIAVVNKVRFHKFPCKNKQKFHVTIGHFTCMATVHFISPAPLQVSQEESILPQAETKNEEKKAAGGDKKSTGEEKSSPSKKSSKKGAKKKGANKKAASASAAATFVEPSLPEPTSFDFQQEYPYSEELHPTSAEYPRNSQFAVLEFEKSVFCPERSQLIGSRLDLPEDSNVCRIAFSGRLIQGFDFDDPKQRERIKVFKTKVREGAVDRVADDYTVIGKDLFSKDTDMSAYMNCRVELGTGEQGTIESSFGKGGKFKARFPQGLPLPAGEGAAQKKGKPNKVLRSKIYLRFKKYVFSTDPKKLVQ
eukprot:g60664.t1